MGPRASTQLANICSDIGLKEWSTDECMDGTWNARHPVAASADPHTTLTDHARGDRVAFLPRAHTDKRDCRQNIAAER